MPVLAPDQVPSGPRPGRCWPMCGAALSSDVAAAVSRSPGIEVPPFSRENFLCNEHDGESERHDLVSMVSASLLLAPPVGMGRKLLVSVVWDPGCSS